jgi:hypothetical protein
MTSGQAVPDFQCAAGDGKEHGERFTRLIRIHEPITVSRVKTLRHLRGRSVHGWSGMPKNR